MSFRRNLPILIALCGSVALHWVTFRGARDVKLPSFAVAPRAQPEETTIQLSLVDPPKPEPEKTKKPPDPAKPRKTRKPAPKKPKIKFPDHMGERTGTGIGSNKSVGIEPLKALEADEDQAFLSRNPGARGRRVNQASNWLMSPGEDGRGGHPGSPAPPGASRSASDDFPVLADPLAMRAPRPQESDPAADPTPPAPVDLPVPSARPETSADRAVPAPPPPSQQVIALAPEPAAQPGVVPPKSNDTLRLAPVSVGPKVAPTPPKPGDEGKTGAGEAGVRDARLKAPANDPASTLRRTLPQPSREAGRLDGAPVALQVPLPFIAPTRSPDPKEVTPQPIHPAYAVLIPPPAPPTPELTQPTIKPRKPPETPEAPKEPPKPVTHKPPPAQPAPSPPAPAAGASASAQATGDGRQPGSERPGGDPGNMSDSEMDPFSKIGSAQFRDGKLDIRFGRKVRTVRPHLPVVGQVDAFAMLNPSVTLKVNIDATGKVTDVSVQKSSGSNEIDQPTLLAMWDWWFEPLRDAKGKPIPDCVLFTISFR